MHPGPLGSVLDHRDPFSQVHVTTGKGRPVEQVAAQLEGEVRVDAPPGQIGRRRIRREQRRPRPIQRLQLREPRVGRGADDPGPPVVSQGGGEVAQPGLGLHIDVVELDDRAVGTGVGAGLGAGVSVGPRGVGDVDRCGGGGQRLLGGAGRRRRPRRQGTRSRGRWPRAGARCAPMPPAPDPLPSLEAPVSGPWGARPSWSR